MTATTEQRGGGALRERLSGVLGVVMADVGRPVPLAFLCGTLVGPLVIALIRNGAVLLDVNTFYQQVIIGVVIWLAVIWDQYRRHRLAAASE
jgi:predicted ABC-type sugar transport system permease subunit